MPYNVLFQLERCTGLERSQIHNASYHMPISKRRGGSLRELKQRRRRRRRKLRFKMQLPVFVTLSGLPLLFCSTWKLVGELYRNKITMNGSPIELEFVKVKVKEREIKVTIM